MPYIHTRIDARVQVPGIIMYEVLCLHHKWTLLVFVKFILELQAFGKRDTLIVTEIFTTTFHCNCPLLGVCDILLAGLSLLTRKVGQARQGEDIILRR